MKEKIRLLSLCFLLLLACGLPDAGAHKGHSHEADEGRAQPPAPAATAASQAQASIQADFREHVQPIFERSCYDCHSDSPRLPWYHSVPGVGWWIDRDIAKGRRHINFSPGFPFGGHGTAAENIKAIGEEVEEGEMPPFSYRLMHKEAAFSPEEKKAVDEWVKRSLTALESQNSGAAAAPVSSGTLAPSATEKKK